MAYYLIDFENVKSRRHGGSGTAGGGGYRLHFLQ